MWQLNADDFLGTVSKGSHGHSKKAHEKKSDAGLVALEGHEPHTVGPAATPLVQRQPSIRWQLAHSVRAILTHLLPLFQKNLNALIQETIQRPFRAFEEVEVRKTDRPWTPKRGKIAEKRNLSVKNKIFVSKLAQKGANFRRRPSLRSQVFLVSSR